MLCIELVVIQGFRLCCQNFDPFVCLKYKLFGYHCNCYPTTRHFQGSEFNFWWTSRHLCAYVDRWLSWKGKVKTQIEYEMKGLWVRHFFKIIYFDCGRITQPRPSMIIYGTPTTQQRLFESTDCFGDSFTDDIENTKALRQLFKVKSIHSIKWILLFALFDALWR